MALNFAAGRCNKGGGEREREREQGRGQGLGKGKTRAQWRSTGRTVAQDAVSLGHLVKLGLGFMVAVAVRVELERKLAVAGGGWAPRGGKRELSERATRRRTPLPSGDLSGADRAWGTAWAAALLARATSTDTHRLSGQARHWPTQGTQAKFKLFLGGAGRERAAPCTRKPHSSVLGASSL